MMLKASADLRGLDPSALLGAGADLRGRLSGLKNPDCSQRE
ncbi:MAG: hypothetical protein Q8R20_03745 [Nanoarchaeota archaeon]|nr:hypothetical protein [Nanoarchaeota archaeon]